MTKAFALGNGRSRLSLDLDSLRGHGQIYACNAIYREFVPDVLVATDRPIAKAIEASGYAHQHRFYTRRPDVDTGALRLPRQYQGFSSGPNAVGLACIDGTDEIFMIGFDLGSNTGRFNNVYADTQFYKHSQDPPTFAGNWVRQICTIIKDYPDKQFVRVMGSESAHIPEFTSSSNFRSLDISDFRTLLNTPKGLI
jgi:hypothetical protein